MKFRINIDDFGLDKSITNSIKVACLTGTVTSTSVLANFIDDYDKRILRELDEYGIRIGLHLNIAEGKILSNSLKTYWNREDFPSSIEWFEKDIPIEPELILEEFKRQLDILLDLGIFPRHIDYHMSYPAISNRIWPLYKNFAEINKLEYRGSRVTLRGSNPLVSLTKEKLLEFEHSILVSPKKFITKIFDMGITAEDGSYISDMSFYNNYLQIPQILKDSLLVEAESVEEIEFVSHTADPKIPLVVHTNYDLGRAKEFEMLISDEVKSLIIA